MRVVSHPRVYHTAAYVRQHVVPRCTAALTSTPGILDPVVCYFIERRVSRKSKGHRRILVVVGRMSRSAPFISTMPARKYSARPPPVSSRRRRIAVDVARTRARARASETTSGQCLGYYTLMFRMPLSLACCHRPYPRCGNPCALLRCSRHFCQRHLLRLASEGRFSDAEIRG